MTPYEMATIFISLCALGVSIWNYTRVSDLERKTEYKDKSTLANDVYLEAKSLIEEITSKVNEINGRRINLSDIKSPYIGSLGYSQGHESIVNDIRATNTFKSDLESYCSELDSVQKSGDKAAFDRCMEIRRELKNKRIEIINTLGHAQQTIDSMYSMAEAQKEGV